MDTSNWKNVTLEYGKSLLKIKVPSYCDILKMSYVPALKDPKDKIENALSQLIESQTLEDIITKIAARSPTPCGWGGCHYTIS